jgi:hypothetical protein
VFQAFAFSEGREEFLWIYILRAQAAGLHQIEIPLEILPKKDVRRLPRTESAAHLPPEAVDVAKEIARIPNPGTRKTVAEAILTLVRKYFEE